jgi:hypothetical protein
MALFQIGILETNWIRQASTSSPSLTSRTRLSDRCELPSPWTRLLEDKGSRSALARRTDVRRTVALAARMASNAILVAHA